jgi:hypothetical protein
MHKKIKTTSSLRVHILKWYVLIHKYDTVISPLQQGHTMSAEVAAEQHTNYI